MAEAAEDTTTTAGIDTEGGEQQEQQQQAPAREVLDKAAEMGWVPKEKFRGNPDLWVDAETFVKKGEEVMPLLRANNRRLSEQLDERDRRLAQMEKQNKELAESVNAVREIQTREAAGRIDRQITAVRRDIEEARSERDTDKVVELQATLDKLQEDKEAIAKPVEKKETKPTDGSADGDDTLQLTPQMRRELESWHDQNSWYGEDRVRTRVADSIAQEMRQSGDFKGVAGRKFLEEVVRRVDEELGEVQQPRGKVTSGSNGSRSTPAGTKKGKSYADLPADAKRACDADAGRLVGANKAFKKAEDYQAFYVKEYFGDES